MSGDALTILQDVLDLQTKLHTSEEWDSLSDTFALPCRRMFVGTELILEDASDLKNGLQTYKGSLDALGVNNLIRLASSADYLGKSYIQGCYTTHALRGSVAMIPSYANRAVLKKQQNQWRVIELESRLFVRQWPPDLSIRTAGQVQPIKSTSSDIRNTAAEPQVLYQAFLNELNDAVCRNDIEAYCAMCCFPYTSHFNNFDRIFNAPEDVAEAFEMMRRSVDGRVGDYLKREVDRAEFLDGDLLCGYHTAYTYKDGAQSVPPIKSRMLLKRDSTTWRLKSVTNALDNNTFNYTKPEPTEGMPTLREIQERTKKWPTSH